MASPNSNLQWQSSVVAPVKPAERQRRVHSQQSKQVSQAQVFLRCAVVLALVFGILQSARALSTGAYKMAALLKNRAAVQQSLAEAREENEILSEKIDTYSSSAGIEELARNSLQMVGHDEILVRVH